MSFRKIDAGVSFEIVDAETGARDLLIEARALDDTSTEPNLVKNASST